MLVVKTLGVFVVLYLIMLLFVPKGFFLYELLRIPAWLLKLQFAPDGPMLEQRHRYGPHWRQYVLECMPPAGGATKALVVVFIHGGGWQFGRPEMFRPNAFRLTQAGYRVFMPSLRRLPLYDIHAMRKDLAKVMATIRSLMEAEGIGHWPVILGGSSSGGHLAALYAFDASLRNATGPAALQLSGLFLLGAPLHLEMMWHSPPLRMLAGARQSEAFRVANPYRHLNSQFDLPVLLMHGRHDGLVEPESVIAFARKLKELNRAETRLEILPDGQHFDAAAWFHPHTASHRIFFSWLSDMERRLNVE